MFDEKFYLVDFNIAREYEGQKSKDTFVMGTQDFAAPEQYGFSESDVRTDIYGLGATVKYLCEIFEVESGKLDRFVKKSTEMDPRNRFQNVDEVLTYINSNRSDYYWALKKYALPGFRRGNILYMVIASLYYVFFIYNLL